MQLNKKTYHSKVLLFGEYLILEQAKALAVPYPAFGGEWSQLQDPERNNPFFQDFLDMIKYLREEGLDNYIELDRFEAEIYEGLYFNSNIPTGYGTGSSGALVAGIYDRFLLAEKETKDFVEIRSRLSAIESFFHGNSSGVDPLISFFDKPILVDSDGSIRPVDLNVPKISVYLLDSAKSRSTQPLVDIYKAKKKSEAYLEDMIKPLISLSDKSVDQFLNKDAVLLESILKLSKLQFDGFQEMILPEFVGLWQKGLQSETYAVKLCGAGGGGYYLAFGDESQIKAHYHGLALKLF